MRRIVTADEMRKADEYTIKNLIPQDKLIERAGTAVAEEIMSRFAPCSVLMLIGRGNNGKDGEVIAKTLFFNKYKVTVYRLETDFPKGEFDLIVDCIFGTGLSRDINGRYKDIIEKANSLKGYKIACDIASGINTDTGMVMGTAFKADWTIAIESEKVGHYLNDGIDYNKSVTVTHIGIDFNKEPSICTLNEEDVNKYFPKRRRNSNKGSYGKALIIGGSKKYVGSAMLSADALSAMKVGVGYSCLCIPDSLFDIYAGNIKECLIETLKDDGGCIIYDEEKLKTLLKYDTVAIGMGLTDSEQTFKTVEYFLNNYTGNLIIDADGLNSLAKYGTGSLVKAKCKVLITPHIGEFSRLTRITVADILQHQIEYAKDFAIKNKVTVMLKNAVSVITDGERTVLNIIGTSGQAKAGSGDVLSGIIAGLSARGVPLFESACIGNYLFSKTALNVKERIGDYAMTATNVIESLEKVVFEQE